MATGTGSPPPAPVLLNGRPGAGITWAFQLRHLRIPRSGCATDAKGGRGEGAAERGIGRTVLLPTRSACFEELFGRVPMALGGEAQQLSGVPAAKSHTGEGSDLRLRRLLLGLGAGPFTDRPTSLVGVGGEVGGQLRAEPAGALDSYLGSNQVPSSGS